MVDYTWDDVRSALDEAIITADVRTNLTGRLGKKVNGAWVVNIDRKPGFAYVTLDDGTILECRNHIAGYGGEEVLVGKQYGEWVVGGLNYGRMDTAPGYSVITPVGPHSGSHGYNGADTVFIASLQMREALVYVDTATGGLSFKLDPFVYTYGGKRRRADAASFDATAYNGVDYRPTEADTKIALIVGIEPSDGTVRLMRGAERDAANTSADVINVIDEDIPRFPGIPLVGIVIEDGQTSSPTRADFVDLREWVGGMGRDVKLIEGTETIQSGSTHTWSGPVRVTGTLVINGALVIT